GLNAAPGNVPPLPAQAVAGPAAAAQAQAVLAQPAAVALARSERPGLLRSIARAVVSRLPEVSLFDNGRSAAPRRVGIQPRPKPVLPQGVDIEIGEAPTVPTKRQSPSVTINNFDVPCSKTLGDVFDAGPRVLRADPRNEADVERALRELIDSD